MVMVIFCFLASLISAQDNSQLLVLKVLPHLVDQFDTFSDQYRLSEDFKKNSQKFLNEQLYKIIGISQSDKDKLLDPKTTPEEVTAIRYKIGAQRNAWNAHTPQLRKAIKDPEAFVDAVDNYIQKIKKFVPGEWFDTITKWLAALKTDNLDALKEWTKATTVCLDALNDLSKEYVGIDAQVLALSTEDLEKWLHGAQEPVNAYAKAVHDTLGKPFQELLKNLKSQEPAIIDFPGLKNSLAEEVGRLTSRSKSQYQPLKVPQNGNLVPQKKTTDLKREVLDEK